MPIPIVPNPALPGGAIQGPNLPDFSGAIRSFAAAWEAQAQVALGLAIALAGALVLAASMPKVRGAAKLGASFTPAGRALSLL